MEYIFGRDARTGCETVRTKGAEHSTLTGFCEIVREYPDCTITDSFFVCGHIRSAEDEEGNMYDWYNIDRHNREIDRTPMLTAKLDYLSMMTGVDMPEEGGAEDETQSEI